MTSSCSVINFLTHFFMFLIVYLTSNHSEIEICCLFRLLQVMFPLSSGLLSCLLARYTLSMGSFINFTLNTKPICYSHSLFSLVKIPIALDMAKDFTGKSDDDLFRKIKSDDYMYSAVIECYETLRDIIFGLLEDDSDKM